MKHLLEIQVFICLGMLLQIQILCITLARYRHWNMHMSVFVLLIRNSTAYRILVTCHTGMLQFVVICFQMECTWKLVVWRSEVCEI